MHLPPRRRQHRCLDHSRHHGRHLVQQQHVGVVMQAMPRRVWRHGGGGGGGGDGGGSTRSWLCAVPRGLAAVSGGGKVRSLP